MHKLMEYICDEMEELERKAEKEGKLSMSELQFLDTLAHTKKNLLKADEMWEDSEYSHGRYGSYARGERNMRYSRNDGYSREDGYSRAEDFRIELHDLMRDAPNDHVRQKLQSIMSEM